MGWRCWVALLMLAALAGFAGCGKKAPPMAPRSAAGQMKIVLTAIPSDTRATLTWHCDPCDPAVTGYAVYRSSTKLSSPDCPGCPILFEKAGLVTAAQASGPLSFVAEIARDHHYRFKVVAVFKSGAQGAVSNLVEFDTAP